MNSNANNNFSIIVPTFREAKNIPELIERISRIDFDSRAFEVVLVDDNSQDGTKEIVEDLKTHYSWLRLIIRQGKKGLSESVMEGFIHALYPICIVMDADLSHPPEKINEMLKVLAKPDVDLVIGSRYIRGGSSDESWPTMRKIVSRFAALIARVLIAVPVKDPLSGFLAIKKITIVSGAPLEPIGWKIGLEVMVKCHCKNIQEVPIHFSERAHGISKLNHKVVFDYLRHVKRLFLFKAFSDNRSIEE